MKEKIFTFEETSALVEADELFREGVRGLYYCGYPMSQVLFRNLFWNLELYSGCTFCYELAAIAMFIMKGCKTAKLVQSLITKKNHEGTGTHAYVEFSVNGEIFVVDLAWFRPTPIPLADWTRIFEEVEPKWFCTYEDFWADPVSVELDRKLRNKHESFIMAELIYYAPEGSDERIAKGVGFANEEFKTKLLKVLPEKGLKFEPCPVYRGEIDGCLVNRLMSGPETA